MTASAHKKPNYMAIFWVLTIFTTCEVGITYFPLPKMAVGVALVVFALAKAALVAMYFMHLKFEKGLVVFIALAPFATAAILTFALMPDIGFTSWTRTHSAPSASYAPAHK